MKKYIPLDVLVAEIKKRVTEGEKVAKEVPSSAIMGLIQAYKNTLSFIDTLEVKEVDLEKELNDFIEQQKAFIKDDMVVEYYNGDSFNHIYDLEEIAKHFFELGMAVSKAQKEEPISEYLNIESMIESYKQRLISQANGVKNSPLIDMCLASYKHGINETLDTLNLSNVERIGNNRKEEPVNEDLEKAAVEAFKKIVDSDNNNFLEIFKAGYKWGIEQAEIKIKAQSIALAHGCPKEEPVSIWHDISEDAFMKRATEWLQGFMKYPNLFEYQVSEQEQENVIKEFQNFVKGECDSPLGNSIGVQ